MWGAGEEPHWGQRRFFFTLNQTGLIPEGPHWLLLQVRLSPGLHHGDQSVCLLDLPWNGPHSPQACSQGHLLPYSRPVGKIPRTEFHGP